MEYTARGYNRYYDYGRYREREAEDNNTTDFKLIKKIIVQILISIFMFIGLNLAKQSSIELIKSNTERFIAYTKIDVPIEEYANRINPTIEYIKTNIIKGTDKENIEEVVPEVQQEIKQESVVEENIQPKVEITQELKDVSSIRSITTVMRPVPGEATSRFGSRTSPIDGEADKHTGVDLKASIGTPIKSAIAGTVVETGTNNASFGSYLKVKNGDIVTVYAHCSKLKAKKGQKVKQGDIIAYSGDTGKVTGPHLHFEILWQGRYVDPGFLLSYAN